MMLKTILNYYWQLATFRQSPENAPYSVTLTMSMACALAIFMMLQILSLPVTPKPSLLALFISSLYFIGMISFYTYFLLLLLKVPNRTLQTLHSLFAVYTVVRIFAFPLIWLTQWLLDGNIADMLLFFMRIIYVLYSIFLVTWQFMITAYIYKHALEISNIKAAFAAIGLFALSILTLAIL